MAACVDPDVARRARASELVTAIALAALVVPIVYVFGRDELCLLEECGRPERAALPFVAVLFAFLILVTYVPVISTWLPYALMGPEIVTR